MKRQQLFRLPRRRTAQGHIEAGVLVSLIPDSIRVVHVSSKVNDGREFNYVQVEIEDGDVAVSVALLDPRGLAADLIARADSVEAADA